MTPTLEQQREILETLLVNLGAREAAADWEDQAARLWVMARTDYQLAFVEDFFRRWERRHRGEVK